MARKLAIFKSYSLCIYGVYLEAKYPKISLKTKRELQEFTIEVWHREIPKEVLKNLVDTMTKRVAAVINARGGTTIY